MLSDLYKKQYDMLQQELREFKYKVQQNPDMKIPPVEELIEGLEDELSDLSYMCELQLILDQVNKQQ